MGKSPLLLRLAAYSERKLKKAILVKRNFYSWLSNHCSKHSCDVYKSDKITSKKQSFPCLSSHGRIRANLLIEVESTATDSPFSFLRTLQSSRRGRGNLDTSLDSFSIVI